MSLTKLTCPSCGGSVSFDESQNTAVCEYCGAELVFTREVENLQNQHRVEIEALTDRIYDLIANKKFIQAQKAANEGLLTFPYSGRLHLCLLMCELNVDNPENLGSCGTDYSNSANYHNCLRYMTAQDKADLIKLFSQNQKTIINKTPDYSSISIVSDYTSSDEDRFLRDVIENTIDAQKGRANSIMQSDKHIIAKMKELSYNPYSDRDIVDYILKNGPQIINSLDSDELADEQGNTFFDFIDSDNNFYFGALEECLKEINKPENSQLLQANKAYVDTVSRAIEMWSDLNDIVGLYVDDDCELEELVENYKKAEAFIQSCAKYELSKSAEKNAIENQYIIKTAIDRYVNEQTEVLQNYFSENLNEWNFSAVASKAGFDTEDEDYDEDDDTAPTPTTTYSPQQKERSLFERLNGPGNTGAAARNKKDVKRQLGVLIFIPASLVFSIAMFVCAALGMTVVIFLGLIGLLITAITCYVAFYMHNKQKKEKFCPNCGTFYNFDTDIGYTETNREVKERKPNTNSSNSKQVVATLTYTYSVDCKCHKCGHERSFSKKIKGGEEYDDGSVKLINPHDSICKYYKDDFVVSSTKQEGIIGFIASAVAIILSIVLIIVAAAG